MKQLRGSANLLRSLLVLLGLSLSITVPARASIMSVADSRSLVFLDTVTVPFGTNITNQNPATVRDPHEGLPACFARFDNLNGLGLQSPSTINPAPKDAGRPAFP